MEAHIAAALVPLLGWAVHGSVLTHRLASARRDPLTGLHTRAGWTARAEHCIRRHPAAAVLLVDLDHFKTLNDTHGHAAGDAALIATADRLRTWCGRNGTAVVLVVGAVLVSMLLAVAVTAASVAVCALVLRSLLASDAKRR